MFAFASQLYRSWITDRSRALSWYYGQRLGWRKNPQPLHVTITCPDMPTRSFSVTWLTTDDARDSLRMFSPRNPWLQYKLPDQIKTIVDLGANVGTSSLYWGMKYPDAKIYAVEMVESNANRCRELLQRNQVNAEVIQAAIAAGEGVLHYQVHDSHTRCRLNEFGVEQQPAEKLTAVRTLPLKSVLQQHHLDQVDLLKVDIEGAEEYLFQTINDWAPHIRTMLIELHHNIVFDDAVRIIKQAGFTIVGEDKTDRWELFCQR